MTDDVRAQYERWMYPQPADDLEARLATGGFSAVDHAIPPDDLRRHGLRFFRALWRSGHAALRLKGLA